MDNKASKASVYWARTTDQREIRIERQSRRRDTSVEPVGPQTCLDRGRANSLWSLQPFSSRSVLLVTDGTERCVASDPQSTAGAQARMQPAFLLWLRDQPMKRPW